MVLGLSLEPVESVSFPVFLAVICGKCANLFRRQHHREEHVSERSDPVSFPSHDSVIDLRLAVAVKGRGRASSHSG